MNLFKSRADAGQRLAEKLTTYKGKENVLVLALPRGGVPVAFEIANTLQIPMTVFLVRKLGVPGHEEFAMGAISEEDICILDHSLIQQLNIPKEQIHRVLQKEKQELERRLDKYRQNKKLPPLKDKIIILVDDGIATGNTLKAAVQALKTLKPKKIVLAAPVASSDSIQKLSLLVDEIICLATPEPFYGVGQWYRNFQQTTDVEVLRLLQNSPKKSAGGKL
ncbi:phosphoribosyltransferase [Allofrancisella guangzhouensis]|uniref:Phosphoribosyl transferase n=2 Tax=Allofrancisella TaxID=1869285 RepID=A0A0A8E672_9GAMM|nr:MULTISPECIES: phosphoribosyltransferase [Allofrancisella]AJC49469.1 phosphoribosyl transferase [Allofrancisella guangzhouensis]MBK2027993.1 phosphoribosyltransferase [Allofrancisella guangzhouensis]MBK2044927.1 phosphoribosyltransferase [Allofrancisella guangzhouensis]MBK2045877.1 phosphoribosyltransferase [Allofrancisella guangzhouensis]QIV95625.1 phosphoribosyltransferase [Allofrancisella inopinata]